MGSSGPVFKVSYRSTKDGKWQSAGLKLSRDHDNFKQETEMYRKTKNIKGVMSMYYSWQERASCFGEHAGWLAERFGYSTRGRGIGRYSFLLIERAPHDL